MKNFCLITALCLFWSCTKNDSPQTSELEELLAQQRSSLPDAIQIINLLEQPTDGFIWLTSFSTPYTTHYLSQCGGFINGPWNDYDFYGSTLHYGTISTTLPASTSPDVAFTPFNDVNYQHESLYGSEPAVKIFLQNQTEAVFNTSIYVPVHMKVINYPAHPSPVPTYNTGSALAWLADAYNRFGVGIAIVYDPDDPENEALSSAFPNPVVHLVHTEDDGEYIFETADLLNIPGGASIDVYIGRGNYQASTISGSTKKIGVYNYSLELLPAKRQ